MSDTKKQVKIISRSLLWRAAGIIASACVVALLFNAWRPVGIPLIQSWELRDLAICSDGQRIPWINLKQAEALSQSGQALLLDARSPDKYAAGHIPGALNLPYDEFDSYLESLLDDLGSFPALVTYCDGADCHSSIELAIQLCDAQLGPVKIFFGGAAEWQAAELPLER
jgi:rhodanese-related sulfurtransferase